MSTTPPLPDGAIVAFDIETDGLFDGDTPPSITCCATRIVTSAGDTHVRFFHSNYSEKMTVGDIADLIEYLYGMQLAGATIVTFNGAGFDFRVMQAHVAEDPKLCETS